ncbi:hypothetical protein scyTo_0013543 [Scyliorhinus torazame]|uniref:Translin n=1 Tax=Scyliorhinus torazame TaxID=75743 RepID=A0A401NZ56_SCYTO|nr:hypothetical protein [Scyliorhinus torazame]
MEIRKVVQGLEQTAREILTLLQTVHQTSGLKDVPNKCQKAREHFNAVKIHLEELKTKFPPDQYYRFNEHWRFVLQRLIFLAAFVVYLETETLVTREAVAGILGSFTCTQISPWSKGHVLGFSLGHAVGWVCMNMTRGRGSL